MEPIHGGVQVFAPIPNGPFPATQVGLAPVNAGGLLCKEAGVWGYVNFPQAKKIFADGAALQDGFYYLGVRSVGGQAVLIFSTSCSWGKALIQVVNVPIPVKVLEADVEQDSLTTLVGFACKKDGVFTFDALNGRSLTANWFNTQNQIGVYTPQVTVGLPAAPGGTLNGTQQLLDPRLSVSLTTSPSRSFWLQVSGFVTPSIPTSDMKLLLDVQSLRSGQGRNPQPVHVQGSGKIPFSLALTDAYSEDCITVSLWGCSIAPCTVSAQIHAIPLSA